MLCLLAYASPLFAADNAPQIDSMQHRQEYMDTITADDDDFNLNDISSVKSSSITDKETKKEVNWDINSQQNKTLVPGLTFIQFESSLQNNYFVAFSLYNKMDPVSRNMVYQSYLKRPNIEDVTKVIFDLTK